MFFFLLINNITVSAGCTACWELKYVQIEIEGNRELNGYIKWNREWYAWFENSNIEIPKTFPENMIAFYKRWENGKSVITIGDF